MATANKVMLIKVDPKSNNNKFYEVTLDSSGTVTKRWGRVGQHGTSSTESTGKNGFERAVSSKKRRGYVESGVVAQSASVDTPAVDKTALSAAVRKSLIKDSDPVLLDLVDTLVSTNRHQIGHISGGMISVDDSGVIKTPLGIIDKQAITKARTVLASIDPKNADLDLISEYLTLVPQQVPARRGWHETFFDAERIKQQSGFLDQLEQSYEWYERTVADAAKADDKDDSTPDDLFRYRVVLDSSKTTKGVIREHFIRTALVEHGSGVHNARLERVYALEDTRGAEVERTLDEVGNRKTLWHGSRAYNVLSILSRGLVLPSTLATAAVTGAMFGNGIYLSECSTKSAHYSRGGLWSTGRDNRWYMFLTETAMGNPYRPTRSRSTECNRALSGSLKDKNGNRYNSIDVAASTAGVRNHEAVVPSPNQIRLTHLLEFAS